MPTRFQCAHSPYSGGFPEELSGLSVIVPAHRADACLNRCLDGLHAVVRLRDEVIVVADADAERIGKMARRYGFRVIENEGVHGPSGARNCGAGIALRGVLLFIDSDVVVRPETLDFVREAFAERSIDALIGSYDDDPAEQDTCSRFRNLLHHYVHQQHPGGACETFWGACGAIRREVFEAIGGFDRTLRSGMEDIELGYRLADAGYICVLEPGIQVKHLKRWSISSLLRTDIFHRAIPWTELLLQRKPTANSLSVNPYHRINVVLVFLAGLVFLVSPWWLGAFGVLGTLMVLFLAINGPFYVFLARSGGFLFAPVCVPLHGMYFVCAGLGYLLGHWNHWASRCNRPALCVRRIL